MKKILTLALAALLAVSLCACSSYFVNHLSKEEVMQICLDNQETLLKDIAEIDDPQVEKKFQDTVAIDGIMDIGYNSQLVEFNCGSTGAATKTAPYGFFYSFDGDLTAPWCCAGTMDDLVEDGDGWSYSPAEGTNDPYYYVEPITGDFYYYCATYK